MVRSHRLVRTWRPSRPMNALRIGSCTDVLQPWVIRFVSFFARSVAARLRARPGAAGRASRPV